MSHRDRKVGSNRLMQGIRTPAFAVSVVALVVALGGTSLASAPVAFIAKAVGLDKTQKKQVKSIADSQIKTKARKLKVKFATSAGTAASAGTATSARTATTAETATTAGNANTVGGEPASAFYSASHVFSTGGLKALPNTTSSPATVLTIGPFTLQATCTTTGSPEAALTYVINYPAGSLIGDTGQGATAGTFTLDSQSTSGETFGDMLTGDFSGIFDKAGITLVAPNGAVYGLIDAADSLNYPASGECGFAALAIQL